MRGLRARDEWAEWRASGEHSSDEEDGSVRRGSGQAGRTQARRGRGEARAEAGSARCKGETGAAIWRRGT